MREGLAKLGDERSLSFGSTANERQRDLDLQDVYYGSSTVHTIKKLQPFTSYAFRVQVSNFQKYFVCGMTWNSFALPGSRHGKYKKSFTGTQPSNVCHIPHRGCALLLRVVNFEFYLV